MKRITIIIYLFIFCHTKKHCRKENVVLNFYKLKSCHKSTLPVIYWSNVDKIEECVKVTREKNGLAFNFSPAEARNTEYIIACQVLGCPETENSATLIEDDMFDYYSAYGNWTATQNAICIKNIGLFRTISLKQNYTASIDLCQKLGADLADITSEIRTKYLSNNINDTLDTWYKVAYIGLDDIEQEGFFVNTFDIPLSCRSFRAWAPGHPISETNDHNCVVLDDNRMWRVVDCTRNLPVLCEFFPEKPDLILSNPCSNITNKRKKEKCRKKVEDMNEIMKNLTRTDQCAILNTEIQEMDKNNAQEDKTKI